MNTAGFNQTPDTLPKLLVRNFHRYGDRQVAVREKDKGIWQRYTWAEYHDLVKHLCLALLSLGLKHQDRISILAENKPHAYWFELAAQSAGAVVVGIFADCTPPEVEYYVGHSGSKFVVCQDQEQVDKVLEIRERIPSVEKILYWDPKGLWSYSDPILLNMDQLLEMGKAVEAARPGQFEVSVKATDPDDMAVFFYSSGTTGNPKAAMVTHRALIGMAQAVDAIDRYEETDEYLSFLPLAWIAEQLFGVACSLVYGLTTNFPEEPETVQDNIREIGPRIVFFGPRLWENLIRMVQVRIQDSGWLNRMCFNTAIRIGMTMTRYSMTGKTPGMSLSLLNRLADFAVFRPLRDNLGLSKTRVGYSAGAAVSPDVIRYFHALGINVKQLYGSSEVGIVTCHLDRQIKPETCGPPLPNVDIQLSSEGEVLIRTPNMFSGYYKEEEKTAQKIRNGWYHTEDFGHLDADGHLIVMDRMEDLLDLAGGQKFSPQYCEIRLRFSPYIKDVLAVARRDQSFVGALVNIDLENVGQWAEARHLPYTTFTDLSQKEQVVQLIREEISKVNKTLPDHSRIHRFINLHKEFDPDEAEMTRTRKLRRTFVEERFKQMIDAIFSSEDQVTVTSEITYRDGRKGKTENVIRVNRVL